MTQTGRPNLYKLLFDDIKVNNSLLDVGFGYLWDLIDFEHSEFKKIEGIDKNIDQPFMIYKKIKGLKHTSELFKLFRSRFNLTKADISDYNFNPSGYSLIICNKVLHFYPDGVKHIFLEKLFNHLQKYGLLYVKINHNKNVNNTDPLHMRKIGNNVFQNLIDENDIRYLVEPNEFLQIMRGNYSLLEKHTNIDDKTLSFVIKK